MAVSTSKTADKLKKRITVIGEGAVNPVPDSPGKETGKKGGMMALLEKMEPEIQKALPETMRSDRMIRLALTAFRANPKLKEADPHTFVAAAMQSFMLGLEPNTTMGEAFIIPRYNKDRSMYEAHFQIGYQGILSLAHRTGQYQAIYAEAVYEKDRFEHELGLHKKLIHVPADLQQGDLKYVYAVYHLINGGYDFKVWSKAKLALHAQKFSEAVKRGYSSPWKTNFESMAKKTVLLDLLKYAPKSIEFSQQLSLDNTVKQNVDAEPERVIIDMDETDETAQTQEQDTGYFDYGEAPPETYNQQF